MTAEDRIAAARSLLRSRDASTIAEQIRIAAIPSPTGAEAARGAYLATRFREIGLEDVSTDEAGNVIGFLGSAGQDDAPVIVAAHLDTVFADRLDIQPRIEGGRILAPGITDNARGLAGLIAVAAAMRDADLAPERPIVFVGTVGEEGAGDLRGVKHLMREGFPFRRATAFIAIDGPGSARIVNRGIGSRRFRAIVAGPGGHSWGDRGTPNPIAALANAIVRLGALEDRLGDAASVNVGRMGGGSSVNSIPCEAWIEIDMRAHSEENLSDLESRAVEILSEATKTERGRLPGGRPLELTIDRIGTRPCGETASSHPLVQAAIQASRIVGEQPELTAASTDANVPMSLSIPAITLGAGGRGGGIHTPDEWFENHDGPRGIERVLLTVAAAAAM